jgi:hypothetical protein
MDFDDRATPNPQLLKAADNIVTGYGRLRHQLTSEWFCGRPCACGIVTDAYESVIRQAMDVSLWRWLKAIGLMLGFNTPLIG